MCFVLNLFMGLYDLNGKMLVFVMFTVVAVHSIDIFAGGQVDNSSNDKKTASNSSAFASGSQRLGPSVKLWTNEPVSSGTVGGRLCSADNSH